MPDRRTILTFLAALVAVPVIGTSAQAGSREIFQTGGIAIHGTDPVAYFTMGKAVDGDPAHALMWMGATWYFSSAENMETFMANPHAYAPQYGGYCAYAAAQGAVATTVPEAFTVHDGKLYLNFSTGVRTIWSKDIPANVSKADANWPAILER